MHKQRQTSQTQKEKETKETMPIIIGSYHA
jgi:hypothetical protein